MSAFTGPGPWRLPIAGFEVRAVQLEARAEIVIFGPGGASAVLAFATGLVLGDGGGRRWLEVSEESWELLAALRSLCEDRIESAVADIGSQLRVRFASGRTIAASPDARRHSWELAGPGTLLLAARPGGGDPRLSV